MCRFDSDGHRSPRANQASDVLPEQHARESLKTQGPSFTPARQGAFNPAQARNLKASPERVCFLGGLGGAWRPWRETEWFPDWPSSPRQGPVTQPSEKELAGFRSQASIINSSAASPTNQTTY